MTTLSANQWINVLANELRTLPGGGLLEEAEEAWKEHSEKPYPVVTIYGAYDTGKSSLLKRLLVDDGREVPEWLTISGRHETFDVNEVEATGCIFRDTPGISSGNETHDQLAAEALVLSDVFLVVLLPQLLTAERTAILDLLTGQIFLPEKGWPYPPEALKVVIARFDDAGIAPYDDEEGYRNLVQAKRRELLQILTQGTGMDLESTEIHVVAADPYQRVGNKRQLSRETYDRSRTWDGMDDLAAALRRMGERLPVLRKATRLRLYLFITRQALTTIRDEREQQQLALQEVQNMQQRREQFEQRLNALIEAARAELDGIIEEELLSASRSGLQTVDDIKKKLETRFIETLQRWTTKHDGELQKLARELELDLEERAKRPGARTFEKFLEEGSAAKEDKPQGYGLVLKVLKKAEPKLKDALRLYHEAKIGMTLSSAKAELRRLSSLRSAEARSTYFAGKGGFKSEAQASAARKYVMTHTVLDAVGPALLELAALTVQILQERRAEAAKAKRRQELLQQVDNAVRWLAQAYWQGEPKVGIDGWLKGAEEFRQELRAHFKVHEDLLPSLRGAVDTLTAHEMRIKELLVSAPREIEV